MRAIINVAILVILSLRVWCVSLINTIVASTPKRCDRGHTLVRLGILAKNPAFLGNSTRLANTALVAVASLWETS